MVRRSFSLLSSRRSSTMCIVKNIAAEKSFHVRSISLPCRPHPVISQLRENIQALRVWQSHPEEESSSSAWLCTGMTQLELLHQSVEDFLHLPHVQDSIQAKSSWIDGVMEQFLCFADIYGTFRSTMYDLKEQQSATRLALRKQDSATLNSCVRSQKRIEKELAKLASRVQNVPSRLSSRAASDIEETEVAGIIKDLISVTASTTQSIFLGVVAASAAVSIVPSGSSSLTSSIKKKFATTKEIQSQQAFRNLVKLEECVDALESRIEHVFKSLINTRVSFLNFLSC